MKRPSTARLFQAIDATWPAVRTVECGPFTLREGAGGGQRVSAATAHGKTDAKAISAAEDQMVSMGQTPLFMIREEDRVLDVQLANMAYELVAPVKILIAEAAALARKPGAVEVVSAWPPLAIQRDIWAAGEIGPARLDVMLRACEPKSTFLGRLDDQPAGTAFAAIDGDIAMLHALEISDHARRKGLGRTLTRAIAHWAINRGARWIAALVVRTNQPANALYESLGMEPAGQYHYRRVQG